MDSSRVWSSAVTVLEDSEDNSHQELRAEASHSSESEIGRCVTQSYRILDLEAKQFIPQSRVNSLETRE